MILACIDPDAARRLHGAALARALAEVRTRTLSLVDDLDDAQWAVPRGPGVNPFAWELGHLAWFAEFWILRGPHATDAAGRVHAARAPRIAGPDAVFDSSRLPHAQRWAVPLPARAELRARLARQLDACLAALPDTDDDEALYAHRLALFHEDMHAEAFVWMRAALGLPAPAGCALPTLPTGTAEVPVVSVVPERVQVPASVLQAGRRPDEPGFSFDNELPGPRQAVPAFEIDAAPVAAGAFRRFVEAGGYDEPRWWPGEAGAWRAAQAAPHPARWRRGADGGWEQRWFERWLPLRDDAPVVHLSAWEAEAWAHWAGRRLPTPLQWEAAARAGRIAWGGSVWEWTAAAFQPYAGFVAGPYRDYSQPWFGDHRELRGGAFATHARMHHPAYRNFFQPGRTDVFAGFRTVAPAA